VAEPFQQLSTRSTRAADRPPRTAPAPAGLAPRRFASFRSGSTRRSAWRAFSGDGRTGQPLGRQAEPEGRASGVEAAGRRCSHHARRKGRSAAPGRRAGALGIAKGNALGPGPGARLAHRSGGRSPRDWYRRHCPQLQPSLRGDRSNNAKLQGLGNTSQLSRDQRPSLDLAQRPRCHTLLPIRLSCHRTLAGFRSHHAAMNARNLLGSLTDTRPASTSTMMFLQRHATACAGIDGTSSPHMPHS